MNAEEWLQSNKENIIKLIELEDVLSKSDPCEQPYKSQYAARDILQTCITDLDERMKKDDDYLTYFIYFNLSYRLANNFISTEERHSGEEIIFELCKKIEKINQLSSFINQINDISPIGDVMTTSNAPSDSITISELGESAGDDLQIWMRWFAGTILRIYNACGLLWGGRIVIDDPGCQNSIRYLNCSKKIYKIYKQQMRLKNQDVIDSSTEINMSYEPPECLDSLLLRQFQYESPYLKNECYLLEGVDKETALKFDLFESDYTTTLFLMAQSFGKLSSDKRMKHKSAKYCYWTLYRQLNAFKYDPVEWALNAATLSQYYVTEGIFNRARHCIAAAQTILKEAVYRPTPGPKEENPVPNIENSSEKASNCIKPNEINNCELNEEKDVNTKQESPQKSTNSSEINISDCSKTIDGILEESINKVIDDIELNKLKKDITNRSENNDEKSHSIVDHEPGDASIPLDNQKEKQKSRKLLPDPMSESRLWDDDVYEEKRVQGEADIDRCWISYGLSLLDMSFDRKMEEYSGPSEKDKFLIESKLPEFNLELAVIEREVTSEWVYSYEEARELFLFVQRKVNAARQYYRLDFRCSDAIDLICDHSKAFKAISNFEMSVERKCIMHKKRIDMLTDLMKTLNQRYYLIQCRKMMLEVGEIYSTMMNLKLSLLETTPGSDESIQLPPNAKGIVQKIRLLGKKGLEVYQNFLESYRTPNGIMPEIFAEDDIRPILMAHFYMARMFSKILEPDSNIRLKNLVKSLEHYQFIVSYCNKHENAAKQMSPELDSCKDMVVLLPRKIDKLRSES